MRISKLKNTSGKNLTVVLDNSCKVVIPPGAELQDVDVSNINEIRGCASVVMDMSEINESGSKQKLND